jgi:hypothetical protein
MTSERIHRERRREGGKMDQKTASIHCSFSPPLPVNSFWSGVSGMRTILPLGMRPAGNRIEA